MNRQKKKIIVLAVALTLLATPPAMAKEKVYFRHKTNKTLKLDCWKSKGRHDAFASYRCYDNETTSSVLNPGADWELVNVENVCFLHQGRDTIKPCLKIASRDKTTNPGNSSPEFVCFGKPEMFRFQPTAKWLEIDGQDQRCAPHQPPLEEVPRTVVFPELPVEQAENGTQK